MRSHAGRVRLPGRRREALARQNRARASDDRPLALSSSADRHQALRRHRPHPGRGLRAGGRGHAFASRTEESAQRFQDEGFAAALLVGDLEVALERQRRLVAMAPSVSDQGTRRQDEAAFDDLAAQIPRCWCAPGLRTFAQAVPAVRRPDATGRDGPSVRARRAAAAGERHGGRVRPVHAGRSSARSPPSASGDRARRRRLLENIVASSRTLIAWVCAAAARQRTADRPNRACSCCTACCRACKASARRSSASPATTPRSTSRD